MGYYQAILLWVTVVLEVMAVKVYFALRRFPELEPHN